MSVFKMGETMTLLGDVLRDIDQALKYIRTMMLLRSLVQHYRIHKLLERDDVRKAVEEYEKTRKVVMDALAKESVADILL